MNPGSIKEFDTPLPAGSYRTLEQTYIENAMRHMDKASYWLGQRKGDFAIGSLKKAIKNLKAAQELSAMRRGNGKFDGGVFDVVANKLMTDMEAVMVGVEGVRT